MLNCQYSIIGMKDNMRNKISSIHRYIYPIALVFFFTDISIFTCFNTNMSALTICFYTVILLYQDKKLPMIFLGFLLSLQSFLFYGTIWPIFAYIIPLSILGRWATILFQKTSFVLYLLIILFIGIQQVFIEPSFFGAEIQKSYTFYKICGNILMIVIFLKCLPKGKLGDRL